MNRTATSRPRRLDARVALAALAIAAMAAAPVVAFTDAIQPIKTTSGDPNDDWYYIPDSGGGGGGG